MSRKYVDCREYPSEKKCTLLLAGEEADVIQAAAEHAASTHGYQDTPEMRNEIKKMLKDEPREWSLTPKKQVA